MDEQLSTSGYLLTSTPPVFFYDRIKRALDVITGVALLLAFSPIFVVTAIAVKLTSRGPIFYRQTRIGRYDRPFKVWKFRTMTCDADRNGPLITASDDDRITAIGKYLRKNKIDELPQLWNVIIGDMSLVGPRPQVPRFVDRFPAEQRSIIMTVRPGITGPTQLEFRHEERMLQGQANREAYYIENLLPIKCQMDVHYVYSRSFVLDVKVLFQTGGIVAHSIVRRMLGRNGTPADESTPLAIPALDDFLDRHNYRVRHDLRDIAAPYRKALAQPSFEDEKFAGDFIDEKEEATAHSRI